MVCLLKSYEHDVLSRHRDAFEASLLFLRDHFEALTAEEMNAIQDLRKYRNRIAHELCDLIVGMDTSRSGPMVIKARASVFRLSNFWTYIDIGADPEFKDKGIDWDAVAGNEFILIDRIIEQLDAIS